VSHALCSYKLEWLIHGANWSVIIKTWVGIYRFGMPEAIILLLRAIVFGQ
jgi:hypothetical protein